MHFNGVVFAGQGTQNLGMGKDFVELYPEAREIFEIAYNELAFDVYDICQNNAEKLNMTEYTQPCIVTVEIAIFNVLNIYYDFHPIFFAGHSLGEYAALIASKVIPFNVAIKIIHFRGQLMQNATQDIKSAGMSAVIFESIPSNNIINKIKKIASHYEVDIANYNSKQQIVLSGYNQALHATIQDLQENIGTLSIRIVPLAVKAPFHSRYMQSVEKEFFNYIKQYSKEYNLTNITKVISNYFGGFYPNAEINTLFNGLTKQISSSVQWRENMKNLLEYTTKILEIGPYAPLRGFFKAEGVNIHAITNVKSISKVFES